jgi:hypothetical protein
LVCQVPDDPGENICGTIKNDITVRLESFIYYDGLVTSTTKSTATSRRRVVRDILIYGICGGVLIVVLKLTEYRFLVVERSLDIYGALVAALGISETDSRVFSPATVFPTRNSEGAGSGGSFAI